MSGSRRAAREPGHRTPAGHPCLRLPATDFLQNWLVALAALVVAAYGFVQYRESGLLVIGVLIWGLGGGSILFGQYVSVIAGRSTLTVTDSDVVYRRTGIFIRGGGSIALGQIASTEIGARKVGQGYRLMLDVMARDGSRLHRWRLPAAGLFKVQTEDQEREVLQFLNRNGVACYPAM